MRKKHGGTQEDVGSSAAENSRFWSHFNPEKYLFGVKETDLYWHVYKEQVQSKPDQIRTVQKAAHQNRKKLLEAFLV